jgi:Bardet-Biedl syndrome 7 protein
MLAYEAEVSGPPSTLSLFNEDGSNEGRNVLYGTSDGKVGLMEIGIEEPMPKWEIPNDKRLGGISCVDNFDITSDGIMDLIVGREDGNIEIYAYDSIDTPFLKYTHVKKAFIFSHLYFFVQ